MRGWLLGCGFLAACGRIGFAPEDADAPPDIVVAPDLAILNVPFGTPVLIDELLHPVPDYDPSLSRNELEIYYSSRRSTTQPAINRATRSSLSAPWSAPVVPAELASTFRDVDPDLSSNGLTLMFSSTRNGSTDLYVTTRANVAATFGPVTRIDELVGPTEDDGPSLSDDELTLYYHAGPADNYDIYTATRSSATAPWNPPQVLAELASPLHSDSDPMICGDGRVLVFSSDRTATPDIDLWIATRATVNEPFGVPVPLSELNTTFVDSSPWLSPDLRTIYFTSERDGERALYVATR